MIPNLAAYVIINPSLQFFATNPAQRRLVSLAVDRAIREIIQPVVERSVTIASVTTKQLILKDFSTEPNEQQLRNGAHLMISNLAGSLALVTCKEPLRVSIGNHLRSLLQQVTSDQSLIEQIVQVCSNDNLELGCMLIEKASTEKAIRDVDESLAAAIQSRRKSREANQTFIDTTAKPGGKYPRELPDALKPNMGGLHAQQLLVYEGFQRARAIAAAAQQQQQVINLIIMNYLLIILFILIVFIIFFAYLLSFFVNLYCFVYIIYTTTNYTIPTYHTYITTTYHHN